MRVQSPDKWRRSHCHHLKTYRTGELHTHAMVALTPTKMIVELVAGELEGFPLL